MVNSPTIEAELRKIAEALAGEALAAAQKPLTVC